jgi:hypothetical protein
MHRRSRRFRVENLRTSEFINGHGSAPGQRGHGAASSNFCIALGLAPRRSLPRNEAARQEKTVVVYLAIMDDMGWLFGTPRFTPGRSLLKVSWNENGIAYRR